MECISFPKLGKIRRQRKNFLLLRDKIDPNIMQSIEQLLATIENYLAQCESPAEPERLYAPIDYSMTGGGKRLRPMLVLLACGLYADDIRPALPAAAAVVVCPL